MRVKLRQTKNPSVSPKLQYSMLQINPDIKHAYVVVDRNEFEALESEGKSKWDTERGSDILKLMQRRQKIMKRKKALLSWRRKY